MKRKWKTQKQNRTSPWRERTKHRFCEWKLQQGYLHETDETSVVRRVRKTNNHTNYPSASTQGLKNHVSLVQACQKGSWRWAEHGSYRYWRCGTHRSNAATLSAQNFFYFLFFYLLINADQDWLQSDQFLSKTSPQPNCKEWSPLDQTPSCLWVLKATQNYRLFIQHRVASPGHWGRPLYKTHGSVPTGQFLFSPTH